MSLVAMRQASSGRAAYSTHGSNGRDASDFSAFEMVLDHDDREHLARVRRFMRDKVEPVINHHAGDQLVDRGARDHRRERVRLTRAATSATSTAPLVST